VKRVALLIALAGTTLCAASAQAADQVFWANFVSNKISHANLDGSGGVVDLNTAGATIDVPYGAAIDPVGGRVYWANSTGTRISWASLDGTGGGDLVTGAATVSQPQGVAVDIAARRIYWLNEGNDTVSWANLDGSGGADLEIGGASIDLPGALAVLPSAGRVYWTNWGFIGPGWISYANLDGSGGATLPITGASLDLPFGISIDAAAGRLYWSNDGSGIVSTANLDGSGASDIDDRGLEIKGPYGLALDPEAGKAYVANTVGNTIAFVRLDETGGATLPFTIEKDSAPNFPSLLLDPRPRGAPGVTGTPIMRKTTKPRPKARASLRPAPPRVTAMRLSCAAGAWAGDLVEAFLYRAPLSTSIQWTQNGADVAGANAAEYLTTAAGNYRCRETATNRAGAASQTSAVVAFFRVGGTKLNRHKGTARLAVDLPPDGLLAVTGKGIAPKRTSASGRRRIAIRATGKKKGRLEETGRVSVRAKLTFTPSGGPAVSQVTPVTLKLRGPRQKAKHPVSH
jgi:DNA-binding beta-propeller fold protein YncE